MIAITFALPAESSNLRRLLRRDAGLARRTDAVIFHTGVGAEICRSRINDFLAHHPISILISSGFAGALSDDLQVGDLLVAENFSDSGETNKVRAIFRDRRVRFGKLQTAPTVIAQEASRRETALASGAIAVDMETAVIAEACESRGIQMLSLRVISDSHAEPFPIPPDVLFNVSRQKTEAGTLIKYLLAHPQALIGLFRFSRRITAARATLTNALEKILREDFS